ncbi:MAG TPA: hypothetical protein VG244_06285 [Acidimicrobiales bacterium]|jgi:hypothetical protein|nr:hypothetical protein [Acidimicrobiales bacterium]
MSDPGPDDAPEGAATVTTEAPVKRPRVPRTRRIIAWVLVVLASLLIPISVLSAWAITTVTNTDQYVSTMAPLARNQVIIEHLATRATDELFSTMVVQNKITDALPPKAKPLVAPVTNQVKGYVHGVALRVFESPKFGQLFDALNRRTHDTVVDILSGKQTPLTKALGKSGQVVLNLTPELNQLIDTLNARGVTLFNPVKPILTQSSGLGLTVVSKAQVSKFAGFFNTLVTLGWAVPVTAVALGVLGILIAVERRKTLLRLAVGVGFFTLVLLGFLAFGRTTFLKQAGSHNFNVPAAGAVWDTLLRFLKQDLRWTMLAAFLVALGAWVAGPARYAVWIRTKLVAGGRWVVRQVRAVTSGAGQGLAASSAARGTGAWIAEHIKGLRVLGVAIAGLIVLLGGNLSGWDLLILVIVEAVYLVLLQLVAHWARLVAGSRTERPVPG